MSRAMIVLMCVVLVVGLLPAGCGMFGFSFGDTRTSDGGGGNLLTGLGKVLGGQLTTLTQDEIQLLNDQTIALLTAANPNLQLPQMSNEQADGFLDFLQQNSVPGSSTTGLNSVTDIQDFTAAAQADPSIIVVPQTLIDAYANTSNPIDGQNVDVEQLFDSVLGAV